VFFFSFLLYGEGVVSTPLYSIPRYGKVGDSTMGGLVGIGRRMDMRGCLLPAAWKRGVGGFIFARQPQLEGHCFRV
jgi:hypothetical protein